jgi:hypothetical protein
MMDAVPFSIESVYGLARVSGLIRFQEDSLFLEFQSKDAVFGVVKSGLKEIRLPLADVPDVEFQRGWIESHLRLRVRRMALLSDLPGAEPGEAVLKVARRHRDAASELASRVLLRLSEMRLEAADPTQRAPQHEL